MESISAFQAQIRLREAGMKFVTLREIAKLFAVSNKNTAYKMLQRWEKYGIINRCAKGVYLLSDIPINDFEIANKVIEPSYLSLESALNFYGILPQFPYSITSITSRRAKKITIFSKEYDYVHLSEDLYWGYEKRGETLIASPEKAVIDQLYLVSKGLRSVHVEEWDLSLLDKTILLKYRAMVDYAPFNKLFDNLHLS